jgi:hypothetical protein
MGIVYPADLEAQDMAITEERPAPAGDFEHADIGLPMPGYGEFTVARLLPLLSELNALELRRLDEIERLLH